MILCGFYRSSADAQERKSPLSGSDTLQAGHSPGAASGDTATRRLSQPFPETQRKWSSKSQAHHEMTPSVNSQVKCWCYRIIGCMRSQHERGDSSKHKEQAEPQTPENHSAEISEKNQSRSFVFVVKLPPWRDKQCPNCLNAESAFALLLSVCTWVLCAFWTLLQPIFSS